MQGIKRNFIWLLLVLILSFNSCAPALYFDQTSISNIEAVRQDAFKLLDRGTDDFSNYATEVNALKEKIDQIIKYESSKGKANAPVVNMWKSVKNSTGNLVNVFELWEKQGKLSSAFISESRPRIANLLNSILIVEEHKSKR